MAEGLKVAQGLTLPLKAATETMGILAVKRAGKSNAAVVIAEEMYAAGIPWVAIDPKGDWWGIRGKGTGPGLSVLVMGGEHGDVPLEPTAGEVVADFIVRERVTCVLDVSEMTKADQRRFLTAFATRLYKINREPLHVFCEEADEYIPQKVQADMTKMVGAFETLVKRGGFRGIGITLVTQRSASLNNDVLTQVGTLFVMRTPHKADRDKIKGWVEYHDAGAEVLSSLHNLHAGEAWVVSPEWLGEVKQIHFRRRSTFDSGATPEVGVARQVPKSLADVNLDSVREAMAATIEQHKTEDPKYLKKRVADLEYQVVQCEKEIERLLATSPDAEPIEVPVLDDGTFKNRVHEILGDMVKANAQIYGDIYREIEELYEKYPPVDFKRVQAKSNTQPRPKEYVRQAMSAVRSDADPGLVRTPPPPKNESNGGLTGPQRTVLSALAQHGPRDGSRLAILCGYSMGGGFKNILGSLRSLGYISEARVTPIAITEEGCHALGEFEMLPTGSALLDWWIDNRLKPSEIEIVNALRTYGPMSGDDLAEATGRAMGGGFKNLLGHLRTLGVITPARVSPIALHEDMVD